MERAIGQLLRFGVIASSAIVLLGSACWLYQHGGDVAVFHSFQPAPAAYRTVHGILGAAGRMDCRALMQAGLLLLVATPMARVAFSLAAFAVERDWIYVCVTLLVLIILIASFLFER